jgi:hypothetical protein
MYNNVVPHWSAVLISCNHSITRLISFTKNASNFQIRDQFYLCMDPNYLMGDPDQLAFVLFWIRQNYADQDPQLCPSMWCTFTGFLFSRQSDIKEAYFRLAKLYHPDVNSDENARENFDQERIRGPVDFFPSPGFLFLVAVVFTPRFRFFFPDYFFVIFRFRYVYILVSSSSLALLT